MIDKTALTSFFPERCPECDSKSLTVRCLAWVSTEDGTPVEFDPEDTDTALTYPGAEVICQECQYIGVVEASEPVQ